MALLTYLEAASRLAVSTSTVRRLVATGKLATVRQSPGCPRILVSELERYIAGLTAPVITFPTPHPPAPVRRNRQAARVRLGL